MIRFTLRISVELHQKLRELAKQENRSLAGQIIYILAQYVAKHTEHTKGE